MALLLAWIYTFDFLAREVEDLELQAGQSSRALQMAELGSQGVPSYHTADPEAPPEVRVAAEAGYAAAPMGQGDAANPNAYANGMGRGGVAGWGLILWGVMSWEVLWVGSIVGGE